MDLRSLLFRSINENRSFYVTRHSWDFGIRMKLTPVELSTGKTVVHTEEIYDHERGQWEEAPRDSDADFTIDEVIANDWVETSYEPSEDYVSTDEWVGDEHIPF